MPLGFEVFIAPSLLNTSIVRARAVGREIRSPRPEPAPSGGRQTVDDPSRWRRDFPAFRINTSGSRLARAGDAGIDRRPRSAYGAPKIGGQMRRTTWTTCGGMALVLACGARAEELDGAESAQLSSSASATKALTQNAVSGGDPAPPSCPGRATRHLRIGGTLSPAASWTTWDPADPDGTSNMSTTAPIYTGAGMRLMPTIYFGRDAGFSTYHVLIDGSLEDLGSGALFFDAEGALEHVKELTPFRMPGADGFEPPFRHVFGTPTSERGTGLDGMTALAGWGTVSRIDQDGAPRVMGYACPRAPESLAADDTALPIGDTELPPELVPCPARATQRVTIRANLAAQSPSGNAAVSGPGAAPSASFVTTFLAYDASDMAAAFELYFQQIADRRWQYRVFLQTDGTSPELGHGELTFDTLGALASVDVTLPLRFPTTDGSVGSPITLDLGTPTAEQGSGVDGVTAFAMGSFLRSITHDGRPAHIGGCAQATAPAPLQEIGEPFSSEHWVDSHWPEPACAGASTHLVSIGALFDTRTPIAEVPWDPRAPKGPSDVWSSVLLRDDRLRLVRLELRAQHVAPSSWMVHVLTTDGGPLIERATLRLDETSGILAHIEGDRSIHLPLVDGRPGPPIELDFGTPLDEEGLRPGTLIATETSSQIFFWASGSPASDCAAEAASNPKP
jgi:flagellar hook protein FlgE